MKIKIINPNTSAAMTRKIGTCARAVAAAGTEVLAVHPAMGPASIESHYDEALAVPGLLEEIHRGEAEGCNGYVIACFGDPGLDAAREIACGPVVGIAEAAMHCASLIGTGFSVVTTLERSCGMAWQLADRYGMRRFCRNVRAVELPVLALEDDDPQIRRDITEACRQALREDGSEVIVLGCAGMADLAPAISADIGAPVVEGVGAALKLVESLLALGLATAKHGDYAAPPSKPYSGALASFALGKP